MLDFLRTADRHYLGLTPGQYAAMALFLFGLYLVVRVRSRAFESAVQVARAV